MKSTAPTSKEKRLQTLLRELVEVTSSLIEAINRVETGGDLVNQAESIITRAWEEGL